MKNTFRLLGIIALLVVIGFSFPSCGDTGSSGNVTNEKAVYTSIDGEGNVYELTITPKPDKAAYEPKAGDLFKLVITFVNGTTKTSEGTVADEVKSGSTTTVTLSVSEDSFTVSISTVVGETPVMTEIKGTIPITTSDDGDTSPITVDELPLTPKPDNGGGSVAVTGVSLNKAMLSLTVGDTEILIAIVVPANATNKAVTWSSSNTAVATVTSGLVTTISDGSSTITVTTTDGKKTATCNVSVSTPITPATLESYLVTLPVNSISSPHNIALKVSSIEELSTIRLALLRVSDKYVNLDLTGSTVTSIGYTFSFCTSIVSITIPNSVTSIGAGSFNQCSNLASVFIPDSVTSIGAGSFSQCSNLASVFIPDSVVSIGANAFDNSGLVSITIPDSVTGIGDRAFQYCENLTSVNLGRGLTSIGLQVFSNTGLTSVIIPDSITTIGRSAFYKCESLASVFIPDSVVSIGELAFIHCYSLTSVTIGSGVTSIGEDAFSFCNRLNNVTFQGTIPSNRFHSRVFYGNLRDKFYETDKVNGTPGTYTTRNGGWTWSLQS
jgi:hypothetical protein